MGQQQLIIVILSAILIGIAITVGLFWFQSARIQSNKDALIEDLLNIQANARAYYNKPSSLGGGNRSYAKYIIPSRLRSNENGSYRLDGVPLSTTVKFQAFSADDSTNWIKAMLDISTQKLVFTSYGGDFDDN